MQERFMDFIKELSDELENLTAMFLIKNIADGEEMNNVMNLVLSAHVTSLASSLQYCCNDDESRKITRDLIEHIIKSIHLAENINGIKSIK